MMLRALLLLDDYAEMVFLQTLLKKLGFDVEGVQHTRSIEDLLLSFNPDLFIATARGKRVSGIEVAEKLNRARGTPKVILLVPENTFSKYTQLSLANVDGYAVSPVQTQTLLTQIEKLHDLKPGVLNEKYAKIRSGQQVTENNDLQFIRQAKNEGKNHSEREARFQEFLKKNHGNDTKKAFSQKKVRQYHKQIREQETGDDIEQLEEERQEYVKAMFRKAKS